MRGVVLMAVAGVVLVVAVMIGGAVVVPLAEHVKAYDSVNDEYDGAIDDTTNVVLVWMPVLVAGGTVLTALLLAFRKSRRTSVRGGGLR